MRHFGLALGAKLKTQDVQIENNMDYWYKFQELKVCKYTPSYAPGSVPVCEYMLIIRPIVKKIKNKT